MTSFRFIHTADLHLDTPFAGMSNIPDQVRRHLQESTFAALDGLVDLAISKAVDFIVISGDIYDAADSSLRAQLRLKEAWDKLGKHGIHVYIIHGNHDPLSSSRQRFAYPDHVTVFGATVEHATAIRRKDGQPVAVVSGISYPTSSVTDNTSLQFKRDLTSSLYHIALLHANVEGQEGHDVYSPCSLVDLRDSGYDYWALGHIHKRQILSEAPWVVYPGNIQGRSMKETGSKGCYLVEVDENKEASLYFHELDLVRFTMIELNIEGMTSMEQCKDALEDQLEALRNRNGGKMTLVRVNFTGRGPLHPILQSGREGLELLQELQRKETDRFALDSHSKSELGDVVWPASMKILTGMEFNRALLLEEDSFLGELLRLSERAKHDGELLDSMVEHACAPLLENRMLRGFVNGMSEEERIDFLHRASEMATSLLLEDENREGEVS